MPVDSRRAITALTIAGSDPTGGAGLQADLRTFTAHEVRGVCAVTAITVQHDRGVQQVVPLAPDLVVAQIDAASDGRAIHAVKIGMLVHAGIVAAVADALARHRFPHVVLDPVMTATAGGALLEAAAVPRLVSMLFPLVDVLTPNVDETRVLTGIEARTPDDLRSAAARLVDLGARAVVMKGGHLPDRPVDIVFDGRTSIALEGPRIAVARTHGTGCLFSSALAARLARGDDLVDAARAAKAFVAGVLARDEA